MVSAANAAAAAVRGDDAAAVRADDTTAPRLDRAEVALENNTLVSLLVVNITRSLIGIDREVVPF